MSASGAKRVRSVRASARRLPRLVPPLHAFVHTHRERVRFGDTDAAGVVWYGSFHRFFEAGRAEMFRAAGLPAVDLMRRGYMLPVVEAWTEFRHPARFDDELDIVTWVHEVVPASLLVGTLIQRDGMVLCEGGTRLVVRAADGGIRRTRDLFRALDPVILATEKEAPAVREPADSG